jgi:hypothetical protein
MTMQQFEEEILAKLEAKYGKTNRHKYPYGSEGRCSNDILSVIYETKVLFRITITYSTMAVEILDPKKSDVFTDEFLKNFDKINKTIMSTDSLAEFLSKNGSKLKGTSPLKFSLHTDDYIFSVVDGQVICSLMEHPSFGTIVFRTEKGVLKDLSVIKNLFDSILENKQVRR